MIHGTLLNVMWQSGWKESLGGEWTHVYVWLNPFTIHLKLSHCSSAIRQYKIKFFFFFYKRDALHERDKQNFTQN